MSETRKLVAILVADVVGYSRLDGADEDRTFARLRARQNTGQLFDGLRLKRKIHVYVASRNLVRGVAGDLFADVRDHFQVSQSANA